MNWNGTNHSPSKDQKWAAKLIGKDSKHRTVVVRSRTGSGKTLAYLLPILRDYGQEYYVTTVILTNVAENATWILALIRKFTNSRTLAYAVVAKGKEAKEEQSLYIEQKTPSIIVATPGRLRAVIRVKPVLFQNAKCLVLDEGHLMLDDHVRRRNHHEVSWLSQTRDIRAAMDRHVQTVVVTASPWEDLETKIRRLVGPDHPIESQQRLDVPAKIGIDPMSEKQYYCVVPNERTRLRAFLYLFKHQGPLEMYLENLPEVMKTWQLEDENEALLLRERFLVFVRTNDEAKDLIRELAAGTKFRTTLGDRIEYRSHPYVLQHSCTQMAYAERQTVLDAFVKGYVTGLISAGSLGYGIDVPQIRSVINYKVAHHIEDFMHRCGRLGRGNEQPGHSSIFNFVLQGAERELLEDYARRLGITLYEYSLEHLGGAL